MLRWLGGFNGCMDAGWMGGWIGTTIRMSACIDSRVNLTEGFCDVLVFLNL